MRERLTNLLRTLLDSSTSSLSDLGKQFNVTTKTIRNEIQVLNEVLTEKDLPLFDIKRGVAYNHISTQQRHSLSDVLDFDSISQGALTPEQRAVYLLLDLLQATHPVYLVDEQEKMQISKSTMDSDLRNLRADLAKYNLTLTTSPKLGAQIEGNERSIRTMFGDVLTRQHALVTLIAQQLIASGMYVDKMKEVFTKQDVTYIRDLLRRCFPKGALAANDMYSQQVTVLLIIWLHRVRSGHYVKDDEAAVDLNKENAKFLNELIQHYDLQIDVASELGYVGFLINSFNRRGAIDLDDWVKAQIFSVALIDHMETEIGFPFSKNEKLFEELYNHMTALFKRLSQHVKVVNPLRKTIQQGYGPIYDAIDRFFKTGRYQLTMSDDEKAFLAMYFSATQAEDRQRQDYQYQAAVVCNFGTATGRVLAAKLEERFNIDVLAVLSTSEVGILRKLPVSLVFKTVDMPIDKIPSLKVNPIPSEVDLTRVAAFLKKHTTLTKYEGRTLDPTRLFRTVLDVLKTHQVTVDKRLLADLQAAFKDNHVEINEREVQPMLKDLINDHQIQLQQKADDWEDAIRISAKPLLDEDYITKNYIQAMIDSVKKFGPYIVIGPSIALAHARPEDGTKKLGVTITTLAKPINFGNPDNDPVKIIFCLAAIDNYSHLNVMKAIVQLINDQQKVDQLAQQTDIQTFKNILFNEKTSKETI
ncbi:BglG family transcription antiterminator [Lacticaseibacillus paracasei]|uniref:BglG family transcription antiterminator n=2 Tax=Lacticaseibacillus TaxID=2759736 RepID=UPI0007BFB7AB|nr:PTS sugar transporter subunit IIA [Lacticaseibacillus paracasei]URW91752.1 PTS sugar transporter subunit IIA [Lacticaseibacillus paracasei]